MSAAKRSRSSRWSPEAVRRHVERGEGAGLYLLHGDEAYRREGLYEWLMERLRPEAVAKREKRVFERLGQVALREHALVGGDDRAVEKAHDQRRMIRSQQAPCRMVPAEVIEGVVVEVQGATRR